MLIFIFEKVALFTIPYYSLRIHLLYLCIFSKMPTIENRATMTLAKGKQQLLEFNTFSFLLI